ncbi:MAG: DUF433 domain-containing protein [Desulfurococcales archaeon]|nr:DUF433 domain-containing protein [Desulfurococcales archaeon]
MLHLWITINAITPAPVEGVWILSRRQQHFYGGKPVIKGTRIPVYFILEPLSNGWSIKDIRREYPNLTREDVLAAIEYAAKALRDEVIVKA